jgi:hypothetical protein
MVARYATRLDRDTSLPGTQTRNLAPLPGASAISIATMLLLNNPERNAKPKACATGTIAGRRGAMKS